MTAGKGPTAADIRKAAGAEGFDLDEARAGGLAAYLGLLERWNRATNLVGPRAWPEMFTTLAVDSLHLARFLARLPLPEAPRSFDLGAGAGLPGIPLRLVWTAGDYHLVEVREKRVAFLRLALGGLKPPRTFVFAGRAEEAAKALGPADIVLSRAFLPWPELLPLARTLLAPGGRVLVLANEDAPAGPPPGGLPPGWGLEARQDYAAAGKTRYFWSLIPGP